MKPISFLIAVVITIIIGDSIIIFAESDKKIIYSNWLLIINSLIAVGLSLLILFKKKDYIDKKDEKANILLTAGLIFWFIANVVWAYYELVLDIVSPVPSLADIFLLSAYGFLIYRLIIIYHHLGNKINKHMFIPIVAGSVLFLGYILYLTLDFTELSTQRGTMLFIVTIAYPALNSILTILALLILTGIKKDKHHFFPWVCEVVGFIAIVVGDSWFAVIVLTAVVEQLWMSVLLLSAHYLLIAGGLAWYIWQSVKWESNKYLKTMGIKNERDAKYKILIGATIISVSIIFFNYSSILSANNIITSNYESTFDQNQSNRNSGNVNEITVGAIVPITGSLSSFGEPVKAFLELAKDDVNNYFKSLNSSSRIKLVIADSKTSPTESIVAIKRLHDVGAQIIVGPASSVAVSAAKDYADSNNIILISYASTSPLLSIKGDNLFRFVPDDNFQGKVIAQQMIDQGIKILVPMWRGDIWGDELYKSTKFHFELMGGIVTNGVKYEPHVGKFATSLHRINFIMWNKDLNKLSQIVLDATEKYGPNSVGVHAISFDEITPILIQAQDHQILGKVRWYGSDSTAENHHVVKNSDSALFAIKTKFLNPAYSIDTKSQKFHKIEEKIGEDKLHKYGSITYAAIAYDALWVASLALENSTNEMSYGSDNSKNVKSILEIQIKHLKDRIVELAESFDGISGNILLNEAGDRKNGYYDFWAVATDSSHIYRWEKVE